MATYVAFAADGGTDMFASDLKYYRMLTAWDTMKTRDFELINVHERGPMIRSWSKADTIKRTLRGRMDKSKRMLLLVGATTKLDDDFVPYEIEYAVDICKMPIIVSYVNVRNRITDDPTSPTEATLRSFIPKALISRIDKETVKTLHIPFRQRIITQAFNDYNLATQPTYPFSTYTNTIYNQIYKLGEI